MPQEGALWLYSLSWEEAAAARDQANGTILIPIGSTEQHAKHLPLGTDSLLAISLAEAAATRTKVPIVPPLYFGWTPHHLALPGTISIKAETLVEVLYDIIDSLAQHDFKNFVVINGHRIVNIPWMQIAAERAQRRLGVNVFIFDPAYASKSIVKDLGFGEVGHAEEIETSQMLYCYPDLVHIEKAVDFIPKKKAYYAIDPSNSRDTLCYVPSTKETIAAYAPVSGGSVGEPTKASKEKGEKYHKHLVDVLCAILESLKRVGSLPAEY